VDRTDLVGKAGGSGRRRRSCMLQKRTLVTPFFKEGSRLQTSIHVFCTPGPSVREAIANDHRRLEKDHRFQVSGEFKRGRQPGWMKLHSLETDRYGAINIEWDGSVNLLNCRIVNRGAGRPSLIAGDFIEYLLARHRRRIRSITIMPGA